MMHEEHPRTRIILIEDHDDYRRSLEFFLSADEALACRSFATCEEALVHMEHHLPDVVVMDIHLPGSDGIEGTRIIKRRWPSVQVIICTVHDDDIRIFNALRAGASGYLLKKAPIETLKEGILQVRDGGSPMSPAVARRVINSFQPVRSDDLNALTAREEEVLDLLSTGLSTREIGDKLFVSNNTLRTHIRHIYEKLHVRTRLEAVKKSKGVGR